MLTRKRKDYQTIVDTSKPLERGIERCIEFQNRDENRITILAFSGGKDSLAAYLVAAKSGIKFIPIYSPTSADPPELIYFIRKFNEWAKSKGYPLVIIQKYNEFSSRRCKGKMTGKEVTMWSLIATRKMPPTRMVRYCCDELKERTGKAGDTVITGVRWEESKDRREQQMVNFYKGKIMVRIIVDWTEIEVWSFLLQENVPYCILYDQGFNRLGCIGCPKSSNQRRELNLYPRYRANYIRAFEKMLKNGREDGKVYEWKTGEDVMKWWLGDCEKKRQEIDGQCSMF
ncbi:MAG: phosphoadenosine phosphosulfate reductase family protein [Clostridium sp.]|uniref:phosphoadenosine phosphosulfate reductase family protein n=1 Tax=Clostridium sp. TaxID=1506 RepID=UPI0025C6DDF0|nr:phosphoadenosine phosphosulfate reductase family protein [Clostridium sp.]MCE5221873.1 phosphoadenosine phosphosulfate reductase family protein [Clostridium sp.]